MAFLRFARDILNSTFYYVAPFQGYQIPHATPYETLEYEYIPLYRQSLMPG